MVKIITIFVHWFSTEVDVHVLARGTPGFSGADLANLVNQAAIRAAADGDPAVSLKHLEFAKDKIIMGKSNKVSPE